MGDEDLHLSERLFPLEERPLLTIRKRVTGLQELLIPKDKSVSPDTQTPIDYAKMREEIELEFETFNSQIIRLQLSMDTNARDVQRYEEERVRINAANAHARETIQAQRLELEAARQEKTNRLEYDLYAADILNNKDLRARDEQEIAIARLNQELEELKVEKDKATSVQENRMAQLTEIHERLQAMLRQIKEDKEEQERREGMDEEEEGEVEEKGVSGGNTPARLPPHLTPSVRTDSEGGKTPLMGDKSSTPGPSSLSQEVDIVITDAPPVEEDKMDTT